MTGDASAVSGSVANEAGPSPECQFAAPPLPVLLRVPRFAGPEAVPEPVQVKEQPPVRRRRRASRLAARMALVVLLATAALPWVVRWRPWQLITFTGRLPGFGIIAGEAEAPHAAGSVASQPAPAAADDTFIERPQAEPPDAAPRGARLVPEIVPLDTEKGGAS